MKIIVDAFGGDNAPLEIIKGAVDAKNEYGVDILLVGAEVNKAILIKKKRDAKKKQAALAAQDASGEKPESDSK